MLYLEERKKILSVLEDLKKFALIDTSGGDINMRCTEKHILSTPTGSAFRRWHIDIKDFIVLDLGGKIIQKGQFLGPVEVPLFLEIYKKFPNCMACIHSHAPWSLVFASSNIPLLSVTNLMDTLGEVPCLYAEDMKIKKEYLRKKIKIDIPEGMVQRPDVAAVFYNHIIPQFKDKFLRRKKELEHHGLAFTVYRHGVFVFAKNLAEAAENLSRVESNAKVAIFRKLIKNEPQIKNF